MNKRRRQQKQREARGQDNQIQTKKEISTYEADDQAVLGGVVLGLVLGDEALTSVVVSLAL